MRIEKQFELKWLLNMIFMAMYVFSLAIQERVTIDKFKLLDILFLPHFDKLYNYITMAALGAK